jgi:integrase/recombinase XerC
MATDLIVSAGGHPVELAIAVWLDAKASRSDSRKTARAYHDTLTSFRQVCRDAGGDLDGPDANVLSLLLQGWAGRPRPDGQPVAAATFNQRVAIVASFYTFARKRGLLALVTNPADLVERRTVHPYAGAHPLDLGDVAARLETIDTTTLAGLRDRALVTLALMTGRRASELAGLRWGHLTHSGGRLTVTWARMKGGDTRREELDASTAATLLTWLRAAYGGELGALEPEAPLWLTLSRNLRGHRHAMTVDAIADVFAKRLGVSKIHVSRHTFADTMRRAGASLFEIQAALGHKNPATTSHYLRAIEVASNPYAERMAMLFGIAPAGA